MVCTGGAGTVDDMNNRTEENPLRAALESVLNDVTADGAEVSGASAVRQLRAALDMYLGIGDPVARAVVEAVSALELDGAYGANAVGVAIIARQAYDAITDPDAFDGTLQAF